MHPTVSVCAIGKEPKNWSLPIILISIPAASNLLVQQCCPIRQSDWAGREAGQPLFVHCVEDVMKDEFPIRPFPIPLFEGKLLIIKEIIIMVSTLYPLRIFSSGMWFVFMIIYQKGERQFKFKGSNYFRVDARHLFDEMVILARKGITIYGKF